MVQRKAVFLDRDGVLVDLVDRDGAMVSPRSPGAFVISSGSRGAVAALHADGWFVVVVTNQPDVSRGYLTADDLDTMHTRLAEETAVDVIEVCPHADDDACECRKPRPGMLLHAARDHDIDLQRSWLVGDRWVDIAAARAAGTRSVLIDGPEAWAPTISGMGPHPDLAPTVRCTDLAAAVNAIVSA